MRERTEEEKKLFAQAQEIAKKILFDEIEFVEAVEQIYQIYVQLDYPDELQM